MTRGALWSAEHPTSASLDAARDTPREGQFHAEERLPPGDQARLEDYRRSGFDRGHMAPSGDMPDAQSQQQTFSLANMVPQTPELNRGVWAGIEMAVRRLAQRRGELFIVTGPAFQGQALKTIGPGGVLVPSATWKAVYDPHSGGAGAYVCSNAAAMQHHVRRDAGRHGGHRPVPGAVGQREGDGDDAAAPRGKPLCSPTSKPPGGPMTTLKPFADDAASVSIGELTVENGSDRIALYGSVDLTRDKQGLAHAHALAALLQAAIQGSGHESASCVRFVRTDVELTPPAATTVLAVA